jgi:hypothetical protein
MNERMKERRGEMPADLSIGRKLPLAILGAAAFATMMVAAPGTARADDDNAGISATGKGITGGALLGGEVVMTGEALFGVRSGWAYLAGGVGGAAAGGYLGHLVEQGSDPKPSYYLLAGGMALLIPTTVAILQATSYTPPADYVEDHTTAPAPSTVPATPSSPDGVKVTKPQGASTMRSPVRPVALRPMMPMSLVGMQQGELRLGIPAVEIRPMYTASEMRKFGVEQQQEVRLPLFEAFF